MKNQIANETKQCSFNDLKQSKKKRYEQIIKILEKGEMTAKEVAVEMYKSGFTDSADRNYSQPRLYELVNMGYVEIVGKKVCEYTHKTVCIYKLKHNNKY